MPQALTRDQVRQVDKIAIEQFGIPGVVLMENAGRGCVDLMRQVGISGAVLICCGAGNNGGDGFVIARRLLNLGVQCEVCLFSDREKFTGDALVNFRVLQNMHAKIRDWKDISPNELNEMAARFDWIVDALLGTGMRGAVREPMTSGIEWMNGARAKKLAVDIPSGLDCDAGTFENIAFKADYTCTFVAEKTGMQKESAKAWTGEIHVVDIGAPPAAIELATYNDNAGYS